MHKRFFLVALALGLSACSFGEMNAMAGTVPVTSDGGGFNFTLTASSGVLTITYSDVSLTSINGTSPAGGPITGTFSTATVDVLSSSPSPPSSGGLTTYVLSEPGLGATKSFGTTLVGETKNQVSSGFSLGGTLSFSGLITSVVSPLIETPGTSPTIYSLAPLGNPGSVILLTYNSVGHSFGSAIASNGTISGTGSFTEIAGVPEPASMALLGIGMTCFLAFRRYFVRPVVS